MKDLLLVVPSRGRPQNIKRLWAEMQATCKGDTTLIVGLDEDDPALDLYPPGPEYEIRSGLRQVVAWVNELAVPLAKDYRFIGHVGDDNSFKTDGWDLHVKHALGNTLFAFGNDLYPRTPGSLSCHIFCRSDVIRKLGYFGPPDFQHMYVDNIWYAWGISTSITYLDETIIEHLHYTNGKSAADEIYGRSLSFMQSDLENWHAYCQSGGLNDDIRKLGGKPLSAEELAEFNRVQGIPGG